MIVLIDNGHGAETAGKRSPDGSLLEYAWTRACAKDVKRMVAEKGYDARLLVPEDTDISLKKRCNRANEICKANGTKNVILVSIHNDAAGSDGKWHNARGMSARVAYNASQNSKRLAKTIMCQAKANSLTGNRFVPAVGYWEQNLAICRDTFCPAVLVECLFQDNKEDVAYLLSDKGRLKIAETIACAIDEYVRGCKP